MTLLEKMVNDYLAEEVGPIENIRKAAFIAGFRAAIEMASNMCHASNPNKCCLETANNNAMDISLIGEEEV